jgi:hypothetical protein
MGVTQLLHNTVMRIAPDVNWTLVWDRPELTQSSKLLVIRNDWSRAQGRFRPLAST